MSKDFQANIATNFTNVMLPVDMQFSKNVQRDTSIGRSMRNAFTRQMSRNMDSLSTMLSVEGDQKNNHKE